jgi:hypothetical protein
LDSKTNGEYYFKHVQFNFSDKITYNLWEKTKVETLSAHCNNIELNLNQSLKKEMPVKDQLQGMLDRAPSKKNFEPSFVNIG